MNHSFRLGDTDMIRKNTGAVPRAWVRQAITKKDLW